MSDSERESPEPNVTASDLGYDGGVRFGGNGLLIQKLLARAGLSLRDADKKLGWNYSTWSRWAHDKRMIPDSALTALAQAANVDPHRVFAYAFIKPFEKHYPDMFQIPKIREELKEVLELLEE